MSENKIVQFETVPQLKLGFAGIGLDEVNIINKYIDDNTDSLPDLSSQLVGQIKQDEKSKQLLGLKDDDSLTYLNMQKYMNKHYGVLDKELSTEA